MNLKVTGRHFEVTAPLRDYLAGKLERLNRHFDQVIDVSAVLSTEREQRKVEASIHLSGKDIFAESQDTDMYAAIDALIDKLDRQIVKHKEKRSDPRVEPLAKRGSQD